MIRPLIMVCLLATSGCSGLNRLRTDISARAPGTGNEEIALVNNLRNAFQACRADGCSGLEMRIASPPIAEFMGAGLALSDRYCDQFFRASNRSARDRRFARATTNDVGGAINVILGLAKAGSGVSNGVAAGFALGDGLIRNYDESYMVDADLSKMQRLVQAAQDNMKLKLDASPPANIFAAETAVLRYANVCSFLGMQSLLNESVAAKTSVIEQETRKLDAGDGKPANGAVVAGATAAVPNTPPADGVVAPTLAPRVLAPASAAPPPPPAGMPVH